MTSGTGVDGEELANISLVRMEDVQPDRSVENFVKVESLEVIKDDYECFVEDENSNIGSMVSIKSEDTVYGDDPEFVVPEILDDNIAEPFKSASLSPNASAAKSSQFDSWPTLEILPGGVIHIAAKFDAETSESNEMKYACAKCEQSFNYLFCLSEHIRWHEEIEKGTAKKRRKRKFNNC